MSQAEDASVELPILAAVENMRSSLKIQSKVGRIREMEYSVEFFFVFMVQIEHVPIRKSAWNQLEKALQAAVERREILGIQDGIRHLEQFIGKDCWCFEFGFGVFDVCWLNTT